MCTGKGTYILNFECQEAPLQVTGISSAIIEGTKGRRPHCSGTTSASSCACAATTTTTSSSRTAQCRVIIAKLVRAREALHEVLGDRCKHRLDVVIHGHNVLYILLACGVIHDASTQHKLSHLLDLLGGASQQGDVIQNKTV